MDELRSKGRRASYADKQLIQTMQIEEKPDRCGYLFYYKDVTGNC